MQGFLNDALQIVQRAVSSKSNLPILKCILLETSDQKLSLLGNDLSIAINKTIDVDVLVPGKIAVSSRLFCDIIRKLPNEILEIEVINGVVSITSSNSVFQLSCFEADEFPALPVMEVSETQTINKNLLSDIIKYTIFATSQDETRPILTGSLIEIENQQMTMVSIDLYRVAIKTVRISESLETRVVIPAKTLNEIQKILSVIEAYDDLKIIYSDKYVKFEIDDVTIISRLLEGEFIKYGQIIPKEFKSKVIISRDKLYQAIDRISLLAKEGKNASIKFKITDDLLTLSSNVEIGNAKEQIDIKLAGEDLEIGFNPKYWLDVLKVIDTDEIEIELTSSVSPCIVRPLNDTNYLYLVLPVRITN